ncbi:acylphosphatase [Sporolactobacillus putidus]|uniref:acylphosphatase n=1 Tax=Sporolactobacillus putidus TaxID=492735 RepID=A0A917RWK3_9BACL|nr:acylphosphatase [Sporolactobacillus putidus]GGL40567.1 acylphosphatase [Sporolactobacillus putidus]
MAESETTKCVHLMVQGLVQAVGFRYFTWQKASEQHITGWVRNRMDGSVEIVAEGSETNIDRFIKTIKKGSPFSHVQKVDVYLYDHPEHFTTFDIVSSV